jgi:hypothetical protein
MDPCYEEMSSYMLSTAMTDYKTRLFLSRIIKYPGNCYEPNESLLRRTVHHIPEIHAQYISHKLRTLNNV